MRVQRVIGTKKACAWQRVVTIPLSGTCTASEGLANAKGTSGTEGEGERLAMMPCARRPADGSKNSNILDWQSR